VQKPCLFCPRRQRPPAAARSRGALGRGKAGLRDASPGAARRLGCGPPPACAPA